MGPAKPATWKFLVGALLVMGVAGFGIVKLSQMRPSHVVRVTHPSPELQAAIDEAKKGLDAFIKELAQPKEDERFAVKGSFPTDGGAEYLWVRSPKFENGKFTGKLDQQPIALAKRKGDEVSFDKKDAVDWLIKDDNGIRGQFTDKALSQSGAPGQ